MNNDYFFIANFFLGNKKKKKFDGGSYLGAFFHLFNCLNQISLKIVHSFFFRHSPVNFN